ncbi:cold-shock protein [uncultured Ralstonia sp.]|uniref:cold-shock protein n=1 Tax=Ralstonia sp. TaxID=54061 RepID=UPI0025DE113B|nr:cold-shock protein [uncultured Ralstonia sp.]
MKLSEGCRKRWSGLTDPTREKAMAGRIEDEPIQVDPPAEAGAEMHAASSFMRDSEIRFSRWQQFREGQRVSYDIVMGPDGKPMAVNIKPL